MSHNATGAQEKPRIIYLKTYFQTAASIWNNFCLRYDADYDQ